MKNTELLEELRKAVKEGRIKVHTNSYGYTADKRGDRRKGCDREYWR
jgi:hypothetical protein